MTSRAGAGRILAMGGHDFDRRLGNGALTDLVISLAGGPGSKICLLPTAGGDSAEQIRSFRSEVADRGGEPSVIALFRLGESPVDVREHLLSRDAIYVGGGSLVNLTAIWQVHELDELMRESLRRGVLVCGLSAGAMIWFEHGVTRSHGPPSVAPGLGVLEGSACVHYHSDPERRGRYLDAVRSGLAPGFGLDDQAGVLFERGEPVRAYSAREGARAWHVSQDGTEAAMHAVPLSDSQPELDSVSPDVTELRQTMALRSERGRRLGARVR